MCSIMSKPKISVILPVYNVEDYLTETLNSILNQSMIDDMEVIMVDDGSTDESRYIIEGYALDYDNFHAYHKDNEGQAITRNRALKLAQGDYVHFLDSDDFIPPKAYETLYDIAMKNNSDMVIGNVMRFARYNAWEDILFRNSLRDVDEVIASTSLEQMPSLIWDTITCDKLYRREFLLENNIEFPNKKIAFEDIPFSLESYILTDRISITPEVCYYWRLRSNKSSTTQQDMDVASMMDRLEILNIVHQIMLKYDVNQDIINAQYSKWLDHDLKFFIKRFDHFPEEHHRQLFEEIYGLVKLMPEEIIESLHSYKKAIFKMVLNRDFDNFVRLAPLENDLFENPRIPDFIDEEYESCFDFSEAIRDEELIAEVRDVDHDESSLFIEFNGKLNYLQEGCEYEVSANIIDEDVIYPLYVSDSIITVPVEVIRENNHRKIEIRYKFKDFTKECILKNRQRRSIEFDDTYLDFNTGTDSQLFIDVMDKKDNAVEINNIDYEDGEFVLEGTSKDRIDQTYVENVISFERIACPVEYGDEGKFSFRICESDLLNVPVKKWEINCIDSPNSIRVSKAFEFYRKRDKVRFINSRNKILIENDVYNTIDELNAFKSQVKSLKSDISSLKNDKSRLISEKNELKKEKAQLNDLIAQFKSRKVVRMADKFKLR